MDNAIRLDKSSNVKQGLKPCFTTALIIILLLSVQLAKSQNSQLRPTLAYLTLGTAFVYTNITGNVEQEIKYNPDKFFNTMSLRIGGGYWSSWGNEAYNIFGTLNWLSGIDKHHMEMGVGIAYSPGYDDSFGFLPAAQIGYRYQKPEGLLLLRAGIGVPEAMYLSLGICF
jgi:hypothetical protein